MLVAIVFLAEIISSITKSGLTLSLLRVEQVEVEEQRGKTGYVALVVMLWRQQHMLYRYASEHMEAVAKTLAAEVRQKRWKVREENRIIIRRP